MERKATKGHGLTRRQDIDRNVFGDVGVQTSNEANSLCPKEGRVGPNPSTRGRVPIVTVFWWARRKAGVSASRN